MKIVLVFFAVFTAQAFANELLECFAPVLDGANAEREDLVEWVQDLRETSLRLQQQRQRCNDLPRDDPPTAIQDRIIQACNAAWSASFAYESSRLLGDLRAIDPELAEELRRTAGECFTQEPAFIGSRRFFRNIMNSPF